MLIVADTARELLREASRRRPSRLARRGPIDLADVGLTNATVFGKTTCERIADFVDQ